MALPIPQNFADYRLGMPISELRYGPIQPSTVSAGAGAFEKSMFDLTSGRPGYRKKLSWAERRGNWLRNQYSGQYAPGQQTPYWLQGLETRPDQAPLPEWLQRAMGGLDPQLQVDTGVADAGIKSGRMAGAYRQNGELVTDPLRGVDILAALQGERGDAIRNYLIEAGRDRQALLSSRGLARSGEANRQRVKAERETLANQLADWIKQQRMAGVTKTRYRYGGVAAPRQTTPAPAPAKAPAPAAPPAGFNPELGMSQFGLGGVAQAKFDPAAGFDQFLKR